LVGESAALASLSLRTRRGDYDIKRIQFVTDDQRQVEAELAGILTADTVKFGRSNCLRLNSTIWRQTVVQCCVGNDWLYGWKRGGAQSCRFQQVTPLADQKAEILLSQQLQRWGQDALMKKASQSPLKFLN